MEFETFTLLLKTAGVVVAAVGAHSLWRWIHPAPSAEELVENLARVTVRIESLQERQDIVQLAINKHSQFLASLKETMAEIGESVPLVMQYKTTLQDYLSEGKQPSELFVKELYLSLGKPAWEAKAITMLMRLGLYRRAHSRNLLDQVQAWLDFNDMNLQARLELMEETHPRLYAAQEENSFLTSCLSEALEEQAALGRALKDLEAALPEAPVEAPQLPPQPGAPSLVSGLPWWALAGGAALTFLGLGYFYHTAPAAGLALQLKKSLACWAVVTGITGTATALGLLPPFLLLPMGLVLRLGLLYGWRRFHRGKPGK